MKAVIALGLFILLEAFTQRAFSQSTSSTQFSNELKFARPLAKRWSGEFTFTNNWMQSPPAEGLFDKYSQWSLGGWGHNYIAARWRISLGANYYRNVEIDEPTQMKSNEIRFSGQGIYYIKKIGYTITSRSRLEWRNIEDEESNYNSVFRFREQVKLIVPINAKSIREGVFYGFGSDEIFLKTKSDLLGDDLFDRNRFEVGAGYALTNDVGIELYYIFEFVPRDVNQINSIFNLDFSFRNVIENLKKKFNPPPSIPDE